jgi:hypothetical protein
MMHVIWAVVPAAERETIMRLGRMAFAVAMFFGLTTAAAAAQKGTKAIPVTKKHQHQHHVHGVVASVHYDKAKGQGEIKVKVRDRYPKKKSTSAAAAATPKKNQHRGVVTFHVNHHTKFEKVVHSQGKVHRHKAHFGDVRPGEHVYVAFGAKHHATEVDILVHQHNKKLTPTKPPLKTKKLK